MQFWSTDLKHQQRGTAVRIHLSGDAANAFLVDSSGFSAYKRGGRYTAFGGHVTRSPVDLIVPRTGHWYAVVDHGGYPGNTRVSAEILPGPMSPIRSSAPSLDSIAEAALEANPTPPDDRQFDVFVSHATEDKDAIVRPLSQALQIQGLSVWYDEFELRIGDSLRRKIDHGLANSRFGVVVISRSFFAKNWAQYELDGLVTREMHGGTQVILPVWHEISKDEIISKSPTLADKLALRTADSTIQEIAEEIADVTRA